MFTFGVVTALVTITDDGSVLFSKDDIGYISEYDVDNNIYKVYFKPSDDKTPIRHLTFDKELFDKYFICELDTY